MCWSPSLGCSSLSPYESLCLEGSEGMQNCNKKRKKWRIKGTSMNRSHLQKRGCTKVLSQSSSSWGLSATLLHISGYEHSLSHISNSQRCFWINVWSALWVGTSPWPRSEFLLLCRSISECWFVWTAWSASYMLCGCIEWSSRVSFTKAMETSSTLSHSITRWLNNSNLILID